MFNYSQTFNPSVTPQTEQADPRQVKNSAGGFTFALDKWKRLERFLILGSEGGTYYATERKLTAENAKVVQECCTEDVVRTVLTIAEVSEAGRAPKNDAAVFALALAACCGAPGAMAAVRSALPRVCRIGTHLFQFVEAVNSFRGWGRGLRSAVANWYESKEPHQLAYQVAKYAQRNGWSHRMVIQLCHPEAPQLASVLGYVSPAKEHARRKYAATHMHPFLAAFDELKTADQARTIALIAEHNFTHEMIGDQHRNSPEVWEALLQKMPLGALVRSLGKLGAVGLLKPLSAASELVCAKLADGEQIRKARLHPVSVLSAARTYAQGHGEKGALSWTAVGPVVDALDAAFYLAFGSIEPTGKRTLLALDVSGSMGMDKCAGVANLTPRDASACLAMVTARTEKRHAFFGFSHRFVELPITASMRLSEVTQVISGLPFERTDCSLPMQYASGMDLDVDVFHVYTDNETYAGSVHPHQAMAAYRAKSGINAKLGVVGMTATGFTIADPSDAGMLDVVGFDTATPQVLADFAKQE